MAQLLMGDIGQHVCDDDKKPCTSSEDQGRYYKSAYSHKSSSFQHAHLGVNVIVIDYAARELLLFDSELFTFRYYEPYSSDWHSLTVVGYCSDVNALSEQRVSGQQMREKCLHIDR